MSLIKHTIRTGLSKCPVGFGVVNYTLSGGRNVIVERARFNRRIQRPGESIDSFIQDLYRLADECNYDNLKDDLIRDRIVVGVLDERLFDLRNANLSLYFRESLRGR